MGRRQAQEGYAATPAGIVQRNQESRRIFLSAPDHGAPGTVVLGGTLHFDRTVCNGMDLLTLLSIPSTHYFKCPP